MSGTRQTGAMRVERVPGAFGPDPRPVRSGIDRVLRGLGRPPVDTDRQIREVVATVLPASLVDVVKVVGVVDQALVLEAPSGAAASELHWISAALIERLNEAVGAAAPTTVTVRVSSGGSARLA